MALMNATEQAAFDAKMSEFETELFTNHDGEKACEASTAALAIAEAAGPENTVAIRQARRMCRRASRLHVNTR